MRVALMFTLLLLLAPAPPANAAGSGCSRDSGKTLVSNASGRIFTIGQRVYVCLSRSRRRHRVLSDRKYAHHFVVRGHYLAYALSERPSEDGLSRYGAAVTVIRICHRPELFAFLGAGGPRLKRTVLAPGGAVAWTTSAFTGMNTVVHTINGRESSVFHYDRASQLDSGPRLRGLRFARGRFRWRGGEFNHALPQVSVDCPPRPS